MCVVYKTLYVLITSRLGCLRHFAYSKSVYFECFLGFVCHSKMAPISRNYTKFCLPFFYANLYKIPGNLRNSVTFYTNFSTIHHRRHILHTAEKLQDETRKVLFGTILWQLISWFSWASWGTKRTRNLLLFKFLFECTRNFEWKSCQIIRKLYSKKGRMTKQLGLIFGFVFCHHKVNHWYTWRRETIDIEWFTEEQAFWTSYNLAPSPPHPVSNLSLFLSLSVLRRSSLLSGERRGGCGGGAKIIRRRENLVLYKSINTLRETEFSRPPSSPQK